MICDLDWGQADGMAISVQRVVNVDPEVVIIAGSNDHLQSMGLLNALVDGSVPSSEAMGEAIMTLLSALLEAERSIRQSFARQLVKIIFVLSSGYVLLSEPVQDPPILAKNTRNEGAGRDDDVGICARDQHDVLGPVPSGCAGHKGRVREVRCNSRRNGRRMLLP